MREAEQRALEELRADPTGIKSVEEIAREDAELLAMLAGGTAATLKQANFVDNVMAPTKSPVLDPKRVVGELMTKVPGAIRAPGTSPAVQAVKVAIKQPMKDPNDPQLELDLFKKMDFTDLCNQLSELKDEVKQLKKVMLEVKKFLDDASR